MDLFKEMLPEAEVGKDFHVILGCFALIMMYYVERASIDEGMISQLTSCNI
jgi:hypothetical protein